MILKFRAEVCLYWLLIVAGTPFISGQVTYSLLGVSGTLQKGFALHDRLDFFDRDGSKFPAIFLGRGLVRGYKSYLDIKNKGYREYIAEPDKPRVPNAVVMPTGCGKLHANIYHMYLVASQQVLDILAGEPRFLSITPDTGMVDLQAEETDQSFLAFAKEEIVRQNKTDITSVAVPLVSGVWFHGSFIETPVVYVKADGTEVTSFDGGIAKWAGVDPELLLGSEGGNQTCTVEESTSRQQAWETVYGKIRKTEIPATFGAHDLPSTRNPYSFDCEKLRFGVSPDQARIIRAFDLEEVYRFAQEDAFSTSL